MKIILLISQIIISFLLIIIIFTQTRGIGLGSNQGSIGETFRSKRGVEKFLFLSCGILALLFLLISLLNVIIV